MEYRQFLSDFADILYPKKERVNRALYIISHTAGGPQKGTRHSGRCLSWSSDSDFPLRTGHASGRHRCKCSCNCPFAGL